MSCSLNSSSGAVREGRMSGNFTCSDSLLTECMPQLSSLFPTSVQYDCSVPTEIFSDQVSSEASNHSADSIETIERSLSRNIHSSEVIDSRRVRQDSFSVFGLDESDSVFNSGIAADDMCSLLEQFEEASQNLDVFDLGFPKSVSEPATRVTSPVVEHTTELNDLEVVKLLKNKNPLQTNASLAHSQGLSTPKNFTSSVVTKSTKLQPVVTRPVSCIPQISTSVLPNGQVHVSANYYREIQDHDYCSNVPQKVSLKPPVQLLSPEKEDQVNPEGSMLKSLLINSELMEKMKQETLERRTSSSSSKSVEDLPVSKKKEKVQVAQKLQFGKSDQTVIENGVGVDFEKLIDADMNTATLDINAKQVTDVGNGAKSKVSVVTVMKSPSPAANTNAKKKTFTLDELISTDMKRKAIEKAKLAAILQAAPRSNSNTPKTSPYQSPRKSDSPKLPELPEIVLNSSLMKKSSRGSSKESSPKVSPAKPTSVVDKVAQLTEAGSAKKAKEAKLTKQETVKQDGIPSRQRTESKCLDVVDMDVDDSEIVHNIEVSSADEIKRKQLDTAREIVSKASELVKAIVKNAPRAETDKTVTGAPAAANIATAERIKSNQTEASKDQQKSMEEAPDTNHEESATMEGTLLTEEVEEELYETAMDIEFHPTDDDFFHDDEDSYQFEPIDKKHGDIATDLNDNTPYQTDMVSYGAPGKLPLIRDPLGLENSEVEEVCMNGDEQRNDNQHSETSSNTTTKKSGRNYRKRDASAHNSPQREPAVFNKLPNYCRLLTVPNKYPQKGEVMASKLLNNSMPDRDRDPSPDRNDPMYNKVPSYVSHFANSTKYDEDRSTSRNSSRCHTPNNLVIAGSNSRPTSRPVSRESSPPKAYKTSRSSSSSSSCSTCSSNSSDGYSSRSRSRSKRRSIRRSSEKRGRRRNFRSKSRGSRRSRMRSRSRSRSPIDRRHRHGSSRSSSRSSSNYSRSRSRSRHRDRQHRGERRRERQRHSRRSESLDRQWRDREDVKEQRKAKQIEERRIVYVGRINPKLTRRELRAQFEQFGEVEETSVHLRESGGDPYGFVTFIYTCDAFAAIENGNRCKGLEKYDLCFGGRRQFCKESYADLDGNAEEEEEMAPVMPRRGGDLDFDALLRQTKSMLKKKKSS